MNPYKVTYRKGDDGRYYVELDGVKIGWVNKIGNGWRMLACADRAMQGLLLSCSEATRRDAVIEGLSTLRIWHGGRVWRFDVETLQDTAVWFDVDRLNATEHALLDEAIGATR